MSRAVILAGGKGTRLAPYSTVLPKPLMPLDDMPIMEVVVRQLGHHGFKHITVAVGHLAELIEAFFGDGRKWGVKIDYSREDEPLGTAGPLRLVRNLKEPFLVMNGDLLTTVNYSDMMRNHRKSGAAATLGVYRRSVKIDLGVIRTDAKGAVTEYVEKPTLKYDVSSGIYVFSPEALKFIPKGGKFDLPELVRALIAAGKTVKAHRFGGYWLDIGRPDDYAIAIGEFKRNRRRFLAS